MQEIQVLNLGREILAIPNLIQTPGEVIRQAEASNLWQPAQLGEGKPLQKDRRNNDVLYLPGGLEGGLFTALDIAFYTGLDIYKSHMGMDGWKGILLHEGLQLNRYQPGGFYDKHIDGYLKGMDRRQVSAVAYLNAPDPLDQSQSGGETYFNRQKLSMTPRAGGIVFFPSNFCFPHEARPPVGWTKYSVVTWFNLR